MFFSVAVEKVLHINENKKLNDTSTSNESKLIIRCLQIFYHQCCLFNTKNV